VDDDILRFIVEEIASLEELEMSHCSRLTDRGIAGTSEDGSDSIRNLKCEWKFKKNCMTAFLGNRLTHLLIKCCLVGLKALSVRACPLVTSVGMLSSVHFPFLQSFDYIAAQKVRSSFVGGILSQNPSLKSVAVNFETWEDEVTQEECNKLRPVKLVNLVL